MALYRFAFAGIAAASTLVFAIALGGFGPLLKAAVAAVPTASSGHQAVPTATPIRFNRLGGVVAPSPIPPGAFVLSITSLTPVYPQAGQAESATFSLTDTWRDVGPGGFVIAQVDGKTISWCDGVQGLKVGVPLAGSVPFTAPTTFGAHALALLFVGGAPPAAAGCTLPTPAPTPSGNLQRFVVNTGGYKVFTQANRSFTVY